MLGLWINSITKESITKTCLKKQKVLGCRATYHNGLFAHMTGNLDV